MGKKKARAIPKYACPFSTKKQVIAESESYGRLDEKNEITEDDCLKGGRYLLQSKNLRENLQVVFRWKLQAFRKRLSWVDRFPDGAINEHICHALGPARSLSAQSSDADIRYAINVLTCLPTVGIPVASAFLMAMHPKDFTIIDRQAYKALKAKFREPMHPDEYVAYVRFCRSRSDDLGVTLRDYDRALWNCGKINKRTKTANHTANCGNRSASVSS